MNTIIATSNEPRITSLEIAELTGKNHKDVMRAIRTMEPAWSKIAGRNFALGSYKDKNQQVRPCYSLTKNECVYIATKFNDEARAKLVLRWDEMELKELERQQQLVQIVGVHNQILENLTTSLSEVSEQVNGLRPLALLGAQAVEAPNCIYFADMAKILTQQGFVIGQNRLIEKLRTLGYLCKNSTRPLQQYVEKGYFCLKETFYSADGHCRRASVTTMVTAKGQEHFMQMFCMK